MKNKLISGFGLALILLFMAYLFAVTVIGDWNILKVIPLPTIVAGYLFFSLYLSWAVEPVNKIKRSE
jgi:hypothetical protein